jgi:glycosyltransferase involved in cell wall biosynthesis
VNWRITRQKVIRTINRVLATALPRIKGSSREKGVQHFAEALPAILSDRPDLRVLIGGDGQLKDSIVTSLQEEGVTARVDLPLTLRPLRNRIT